MRFLFLFLLILPVYSAVLEDLIKNGTLKQTLTDKKVGYFLGSFDPLHKGHEALAELALRNEWCDFVLIYPAWGGDGYKARVDVQIRLEMLFSVLKDHEKVIVTCLPPKELQEALLALDSVSFMGIIGSDIALQIHAGAPGADTYMMGIPIEPQFAKHTFGCCIALRADSFVIARREGDDITHVRNFVGHRKVIGVIEDYPEKSISSTTVKKVLKRGESISELVSEPVIELIKKNNLYT